MHISFSPTLGEAIELTRAFSFDETVRARFTASLLPRDYAELERDGVKVQLWSDLPAQGRSPGEWGELDFQEQQTSQDDASTTNEGSVLSLSPSGHGYIAVPSGRVLYLECDLPLGDVLSFKFTYRLLYPSGHVRWLGGFGHNGTVTINSSLSRVTLAQGWTSESMAHATYMSPRTAVGDIPVLKISDCASFEVWTIGNEGISRHGLQNGVLLVFIPHYGIFSKCPMPPFALIAEDTNILMTRADGNILANGDANVKLQILATPRNAEALVNACPPCIHSRYEHSVLLLASTKPQPINALVLPLPLGQGGVREATLDIDMLSQLVPESPQMCIHAPASEFTLTTAPSTSTVVKVSATGDLVIVSPLIVLSTNNVSLRLAIVTPHNPCLSEEVNVALLPTPPPSPRLPPTARTQTSLKDAAMRLSSSSSSSPMPDGEPRQERASDPQVALREPHRARRTTVINSLRFLLSFTVVLLRNILGRVFNVFYGRRSRTAVQHRAIEEPRVSEDTLASDALQPSLPSPPSDAERLSEPLHEPTSCNDGEEAPLSGLAAYVIAVSTGNVVLIACSEDPSIYKRLRLEMEGQQHEYSVVKSAEGFVTLEAEVRRAGKLSLSLAA